MNAGKDNGAVAGPGEPRYRTIFGVDVKDSTTRNDTERRAMRAAMYTMVERSLSESGVVEDFRDDLLDRGDGVIALIHPVDTVPKTRLLDTVIPYLNAQLMTYAANHVGQPLRLRAVLHAGEVSYDDHGAYGEQMDVAFRLLESRDLKQRFNESPDSLLILVVSEPIYHGIVRHGYDGIKERAFSPVTQVLVGGQTYQGWAYLPPVQSGKADRTNAVDARGRRIARPSWRFRYIDLRSGRDGEPQASHA